MKEELISQGNKMIGVNGCIICYDDYGNGVIPIIFIHGFPFDKSSWEPQLKFFKDSHRVIAYDIQGFGKSIATNEKMSISLFADDLVKFMDALEIKKAIICGLSMGGYILLNALSRYSERFYAIVLCDTQCISDSTEGKEKRILSIEKIKKVGINDFAETFIKSVFCSETFNNNRGLVDKVKNIIIDTPTHTIINGMIALAERSENCSTLDKIDIPTLIICGNEDIVTPLAQSRFLNQSIKKSELVVIYKAGHLSNLEQPDIFNTELLNFILKLSDISGYEN